MATLDSLPTELFLDILQYLPSSFLQLTCRRVNKAWKKATYTAIIHNIIGTVLFVMNLYDILEFDALEILEFVCVGVIDNIVHLQPLQQNYYGSSGFTDVECVLWRYVFLKTPPFSDLKLRLDRNSNFHTCGPWTIHYSAVNDRANQPTYSDFWIQIHSLQISLDAILQWDGPQQIIRKYSRALLTPAEIKAQTDNKKKIEDNEDKSRQEMWEFREQRRLDNRCATCSNRRAQRCIRSQCKSCCRSNDSIDCTDSKHRRRNGQSLL